VTPPLAGYLLAPTPSFWRSLRHLSDSRVVVTLLLLAYVPYVSRGGSLDLSFDRQAFLGAAGIYAVVAVLFSFWVRFSQRGFHLQLLGQIVTDIVLIGCIMSAAGGARSGLGVLMITPTAGAAILSTQAVALGIAAIASLTLLGESSWRLLTSDELPGSGTDGSLFTAAVISATLFILVLFVNLLARRLNAQEDLARRRGEDLSNQLAINQLVIAELDDGVVVLDGAGSLKAVNPKARELLGGAVDADIRQGNRRALETLRALAASHQLSADVSLSGPRGRARRLRARILTVPDGEARPAHGAHRVILLEDLAQVDERAQQLKLASMGRMSASIAHEIRNPLGAIRHAGGLLAEQVAEPRLKRLTQIIEKNSMRIDRIVEDVLSISRRNVAREPIDPPSFFSTFLPEFVDQSACAWERIGIEISSAEPIQFDPNHLRQVLVNLLGNALRFASDSQGAILVRWADEPGHADESARPRLRILDDGPGVPDDHRPMLFEPFFTTDSRGTGLGLHMAREFCLANGAQLRYEAILRDPAVDGADEPEGAGRYSGAFVIEPTLVETGPEAAAAPPVSGSTVAGSPATGRSRNGTWQRSKQTA
jgi:two-component system sensor histidine kinase PilS (NtrC family)